MDPARIEEYHQSRNFADKAFRSACYAPHVSMYFDTFGNVLACCQNTKFAVGNVQKERLAEIWNGAKIQKLRTALEKDRFGAGCQFCEWQISVGNYVNAYARKFDVFPVDSREPLWPQMMEFSVSNTCNLECIMCVGTLSSSIRARREGLPPLPKAYGEQFFEDLRPFLHHLKFAKFLGGEPFLEAESMRIWDLMHEEGVSFHCNVTTNGTQWNDRIVKVLERFPISICISMDGATKSTVESIRINANFETVHENFRRFHQYTKERGTSLTLTYCLMRQNWHEFGDYLLFADEWNCPVYVNLVREPAHCSLYTLPIPELAGIVESLDKQGETLVERLGKNRAVWIEQLTAMRRRVNHAGGSTRSPFTTPLALMILDKVEEGNRPNQMTVERATAKLHESVGADSPIVRFHCDENDLIQSVQSEAGAFLGLPIDEIEGRLFSEVVRSSGDRVGSVRIVPVLATTRYIDRILHLHHRDGRLEAVRLLSIPKVNEYQMPAGTVTVAASTRIAADARRIQPSNVERIMNEWSKDGPRLELLLGPEGRLVSFDAHDHDLFGLAPKLATGMKEAEIDRACVEAWGPAQSIHDHLEIDCEMRTFSYVRDAQLLIVRTVVAPKFNESGEHIGFVRCSSVGVMDPIRAAEASRDARSALEQWSQGGKILRLFHTRKDEIFRTAGDPEVLLGVAPEILIGTPGWRIPEALEQKFGSNRVTSWRLKPEGLTVEIAQETPDGAHLFRMISVPSFNERGRYEGSVRYVARSPVGPRSPAPAPMQPIAGGA